MKHLLSLGVAGAAGFVALIAAAPYRLQRITAFLDPWSDPLVQATRSFSRYMRLVLVGSVALD